MVLEHKTTITHFPNDTPETRWPQWEPTAVLRTKILPAHGLDSIRIWCLRGEHPQNTDNAPGGEAQEDVSCDAPRVMTDGVSVRLDQNARTNILPVYGIDSISILF